LINYQRIKQLRRAGWLVFAGFVFIAEKKGDFRKLPAIAVSV
jgi:hypothetical protein